MKTFDVVVIGGGIVGSACAAAIAAEKINVALVEADSIAMASTAEGMGHIVIIDDCEPQTALSTYSRKLWHDFSELLPPECEFEQAGTIWIASNNDELENAKEQHASFTKRGINSELLDEKSLLEAEPNLREGLAGGLLVKEDCVVYQPAVARFLIKRAIKSGLTLFENTRVASIEREALMLNNGERIQSKVFVNAAGCAAQDLSPELKIIARKGHLAITNRSPGFLNQQLIELGYTKSAHGRDTTSVAFNLQPRKTGQVIIGSSRQLGVTNRDIDFNLLMQMVSRAASFVPSIRDLSIVRSWTGFRPCTPDNLPYIGPCVEQENVIAAAGHEGLGITNSLATATLITDMLLQRPISIDPVPFSPARLKKITI